MTDTEHARIELRADTATNWTAANPTLAAGEPGWETDTKKLKVGDGATAWSSLAYYAPGVTDPEVVRDTIATALVAGTNVTITPDDPGDHITIASSGGGGGGITQAFVGTTSPGGTMTALATKVVYAKKITLANDCLLTSIDAYIDGGAADSQVDSLSAALYADSSGTPSQLLAAGTPNDSSMLFDAASGGGGSTVGRWVSTALGRWLAAGDYWIAVSAFTDTGIGMRIANTTSGTDRTYTSGGSWFSDWGYYTPSTTTTNYSIRANTIR